MGTDGGLGELGAQLPTMDAPLVQVNHESRFSLTVTHSQLLTL